MKSIIHSNRSANMFGGSPENYLPIHEIIDWQKLFVTPLVFGRFFLHHVDIGLPIIESIFGKGLSVTKTPMKLFKYHTEVRYVFLQHIFEDFGGIVTFKNHWLPSFRIFTIQRNSEESVKEIILKEFPLCSEVDNASDLEKLFDIINLRMFTKDEEIFKHPGRFAIFHHPLGCSLAIRILGKQEIGPYATFDILERIMVATFGKIPTFDDYLKLVEEKYWMLAPKEEERLSQGRVLDFIDHYKEGNDCSIEMLRPPPDVKIYPMESITDHSHCAGEYID